MMAVNAISGGQQRDRQKTVSAIRDNRQYDQ
jgi:hypothetical protein